MVIVGLIGLIFALYLIGNNQNLFGSTIKLHTSFTTVNGLVVGNNVRYMGIDVGTVSDVKILNDTLVQVEMTIESEAMEYIKTNAIATIGTDGLMGNKLVNIQSADGNSPYIKDGGKIESIAPLDTDEIMRTLSETNEDIFVIAQNLKNITGKIEEENMIWELLEDSLITINIRHTLQNLESTSRDLSVISQSFKGMAKDIESGKGLVGSLIYDTTFMYSLDETINNIQSVSDSLNRLTTNISSITDHIKKGEGAAGKILMDDEFEKDLDETMNNVREASKALDENMKALQSNILFRRYFKKKAKKAKKLN